LIHRDLKPGNILFLRKGDLNSIKICDFGFANEVGSGFFDQNDDNVGTLIYQAPEQMKSTSYGKKADIWAIGMIMYEILTKGGHPLLGLDFYNNLDMSVDEYKKKISKLSSHDGIVQPNDAISELALKLLQNMLSLSPNVRYTSHRVLKHPWVTRDMEAQIPLNMYEEMQLNMRAYEKLKFATRMAFAMSMMDKKVLKNTRQDTS
jgi:serine/threonine protein kinase